MGLHKEIQNTIQEFIEDKLHGYAKQEWRAYYEKNFSKYKRVDVGARFINEKGDFIEMAFEVKTSRGDMFNGIQPYTDCMANFIVVPSNLMHDAYEYIRRKDLPHVGIVVYENGELFPKRQAYLDFTKDYVLYT